MKRTLHTCRKEKGRKGRKEESTVVRRAVVEDVVRMHHEKGIKKGWQHRPTERNRQDNKQRINNKG